RVLFRSLAGHIRRLRPSAVIVAGGYDPSLAPDAYEPPHTGVDFVVRGEGEITFRELLRVLERGARPQDRVSPLAQIRGLSWRHAGKMHHNPDRPDLELRRCEKLLPKR